MNMDEPIEPPRMSDAVLDEEELRALWRDLRLLGTVDEVVVKAGAGRVEEAGSYTLDDAERMIRERSVRGVQVRYRHDGAVWWDTLMIMPGGVRLVRVRHEFGPG